VGIKDCKNGDRCESCDWNEVSNIDNLSPEDYNITFRDGSNWYGSQCYIKFLESYCVIKSVCKRYKKGE
jgi:hypothetical protein